MLFLFHDCRRRPIMKNFMNNKSFYAKKWSIDILMDILGGILIALGTYNFAALAQFPMAGLNGIALIFYHLWGLPIGRTALLLNIPIALICFPILGRQYFLRSVRTIITFSCIYRRPDAGGNLCRSAVRPWICSDLYERNFYRRRRLYHVIH